MGRRQIESLPSSIAQLPRNEQGVANGTVMEWRRKPVDCKLVGSTRQSVTACLFCFRSSKKTFHHISLFGRTTQLTSLCATVSDGSTRVPSQKAFFAVEAFVESLCMCVGEVEVTMNLRMHSIPKECTQPCKPMIGCGRCSTSCEDREGASGLGHMEALQGASSQESSGFRVVLCPALELLQFQHA
mgnify:CR=1 FL=1